VANVVPVMQSVHFDGTNNTEVTDLITDSQFTLTESSETRIRWQMMGESDPLYITVYADQWLLFQPGNDGMVPVRGVSDADYAKYYHEIS
jgi:hypothetical protein